MGNWIIDGMVFLGSALMVYNICGFIRFARYVRGLKSWGGKNRILQIPIVLLVLFLLGYLAVGLFGKPDWIVSMILFGGSIFVFVMYKLLFNVTHQIVEMEQLERKLQVAEESSRTKTSFLASISHEMRTPMNVILGLDEVALKDPEVPPQTREQLVRIGQSGRHLLDMINRILEMNEIETGALKLRNEEFSITDALGQVNAIARTLCEEKGLRYEASLGEDAAFRCIGDEVRFKETLLSLLDNAVKYTNAPGTVSLRAECVSREEKTRTLRVTVRDTGVGISRDFLPKVFDVFSREDASSTSLYGGSGLSLAVVKRIVEMTGGTIAVESEKNVGTTFTLTVPLAYAGEEESPAEPPEKPASLEGRRVLIVEDLPENAEIVADLLELEDMETEHAENGQAALEMFSRAEPWHYDAILMDLRMPVMDGLEATRRIRALDRADAGRIPIIALTANAFESDVRASLEAGMNAHLAKPVDAEKLYETLSRSIREAAEAASANARIQADPAPPAGSGS